MIRKWLISSALLAGALACNGGGSDGGTSTSSGSGSSSGATSSGATGTTEVKDTFSHACSTDDDCTTAFFGNTCGICSSSNSAIAKSDRDAYQKAYNEARTHCPANGAVGDCATSYAVSQCSASKTCTFVSCGFSSAPKDEHHCAGDGG